MTRPNKKKTVVFDPEYDQKLLDVVLGKPGGLKAAATKAGFFSTLFRPI